jgi:hypothetical protein
MQIELLQRKQASEVLQSMVCQALTPAWIKLLQRDQAAEML